MKKLLLAMLLALTAPAADAARKRASAPEPEPSQENWSTLKMEATAIMGELKYQHGDHAGAGETFRDSLNSSKQIVSPQDHVIGLDLYRTAELAARRGDFESASKHLDILLSRFPDTDYAHRGEELRKLLPKAKAQRDDYDSATPVISADEPEFLLTRIQAAVRADQNDEALELCRQFLSLHHARPEAQEVRLLGGTMYLRLGDAAGAKRAFAYLASQGTDAEVRAKAIHLLAATELSLGDAAAAKRAVPDVRPTQSFSEWLSRAQAFRAAAEDRLGERPAARARYRRLLDSGISSPVRSYALAAIATDWDRRGNRTQAAKQLEQTALEAGRWGMDELRDGAELAQAHVTYKARDFPRAATLYGAFARAHVDHPQRGLALYQQGLALKRMGQRERAAAAFSELVERAPQSVYAVDAHLQLGQLYTDLGAADKAVAEYERMAKSGQELGDREAQLLIAQVHYNQKRYTQAIPLYWSFLERNPNDARHREVEDLLLTSYWLGARQDPGLAKAVALYPRHAIVPHIRWELGVQAYKSGDFAKAAESFDRFSSDFPKSKHAADSLFYLAESQLKMGQPQQAAQSFSSLLARFPRYEHAKAARLRLAAAHYDNGDFDAAARAYSRAAVGAGEGEALFNAALSLSKAGRQAAATATYEKLMTKFPRHPKASYAWLQIAQGREAAGRLSQAAAAYLKVTADADRASAIFAAARLHEKLKQRPLAMKTYEKLRGCRPASDGARLRGLMRLGLLYELQEKPMKAMPLYHEVLKLSARNSADFNAALQRMQSLSGDGKTRSGAR